MKWTTLTEIIKREIKVKRSFTTRAKNDIFTIKTYSLNKKITDIRFLRDCETRCVSLIVIEMPHLIHSQTS